MAKRKQPPTVEIHLTVDGCILQRQPKGVRVVIKDYETDPDNHRDDGDAAVFKKDRHGYEYILTDFPAR